tara:strand:+ start:250 stop:1065 length:816 start_codon:yes stop_codon:yes gene_type:complete
LKLYRLLKLPPILKPLFFLLLFFIFSCSKKQKPKGVVYARVANQWLSSDNIDSVFSTSFVYEKDLPKMIDSWVETSLFYNEAKKLGLNKDLFLIKKREEYFKQLLVSSYIDSEIKNKISISEDTIKAYYLKNKQSFIRKNDEVFTEQFFVNNLEDGNKLKKLLLLKKDISSFQNKIVFSSFGTIKKGRLSKKIDNALFKNGESVVGPLESKKGIVLFKIIKSFKKGSFQGLDEVHDEVYQRVLKLKTNKLRFVLLDSLKSTSGVFINSKFR